MKSKESKNKSTIVSIFYVLAIITLIFRVLISIFFGVTLHSRLLQEYGYIPSWYVLFITVLQSTRKHFIFAAIFFAAGSIMDDRESKRSGVGPSCEKAYMEKPDNVADSSDVFCNDQVTTEEEHNHADF